MSYTQDGSKIHQCTYIYNIGSALVIFTSTSSLSTHPISLFFFFFFFKPQLKSQVLNEKKVIPKEAIKNSPDGDPEGYPTILVAPMCNGGLVS